MENILVSIIIPTKNSEKDLEKCLISIKNQTYKNIEIIVVDNYSTDNTMKIAKQYTNKIFSAGPERSSQVNRGAELALGRYIYRVDSDFSLEPTVVEEAVSQAEHNNYAAILIHNTSDPTVSFWAKVRKFERDMYSADDTNVAVRFIRRDIFLAIGGFDPALVAGEDYDLHNRIIEKYKIGKISAKEIHLGEPKTLGEIARKHYYYGKTINMFLERNKSRGIKQVSPFRGAYLKHYKEFLKHPGMSIGFAVYQLVRYSAASLGIVSTKFKVILKDLEQFLRPFLSSI